MVGTRVAIPVGMSTRHIHSRLLESVTVTTPARLHLGFLDLSGALGRRFGSLGLTIDGFQTRLVMSRSRQIEAHGPDASRAEAYARRLTRELDLPQGVAIRIENAIPGHLGLGSGTQMSLAVGAGLASLYDLDMDTRSVAEFFDRGARSGIGIGSFDHGGFLMDSGRGDVDGSPPLVSRLDFPDAWRILLVMDVRGQGLHGEQEVEAFKRLPPFPQERAAHLCHLALMQILPALAEQALEPFAEGIAEVQRTVGDHFAPAQGGRFTSPAVAEALAFAESCGYAGIGQSSWGPTGFVMLPDQASAEQLVAQAKQRFGDLSPLRFRIVSGINHGSSLSVNRQVEPLKKVP